jgi:hypothetical protein
MSKRVVSGPTVDAVEVSGLVTLDAEQLQGRDEVVIQVVVPGTATYDVQGSLDGTNFTNIHAAETGGGSYACSIFKFYRLNVTAHSGDAVQWYVL